MTEFGRDVVAAMNELGMLVDLSHANMATMADAIEASSSPVVISHTACQSVHENERNTTDENLRRLADAGGVVGVCQIRPFLTELKQDNLPAYFDHLDHAINIIV